MQGKAFAKAWKMRRSTGPGQLEKYSLASKPDVAYRVKFTHRAERDLDLLYESVGAEHFDAALKWYRGLKRAILSLEHSPLRCPLIPEDQKLRHLLYGKKHVYRVIYRVMEKTKTVEVLHIRHGAMDRFLPGEVIRIE
jgi:toxin ParE1/3/4